MPEVTHEQIFEVLKGVNRIDPHVDEIHGEGCEQWR